MNAKATAPFDLILWAAPGDADLGSISVGTQWNEYTVNFTPSDNYENFVFAAGKLGGELDIKSLSLCEEGSTNNLIVNGDIKGDEVPCTKPYSWHTVTTDIQEVAESQVVEIPVSVGHLTFDDGKNLGGWGMDNTPKIVMVFVRLVTTLPRRTLGIHKLTMNQVSLSRMVKPIT